MNKTENQGAVGWNETAVPCRWPITNFKSIIIPVIIIVIIINIIIIVTINNIMVTGDR